MSRVGFLRLLVVGGFVVALEVLCRTGIISKLVLIAPSEMAMHLVRILTSRKADADILESLTNVVMAVVLSVVGGFAIGAMKAIWDAGLRVPDDIAIVGAGDIALGDLLRVPLTTVSWSRDEQGKLAAKLLLDRIGPEPSDQFRSVVIPPHLIVRRSSAGE